MFSSNRIETLEDILCNIKTIRQTINQLEYRTLSRIDLLEKKIGMIYRPGSIMDQFKKDDWSYRKNEIISTEKKVLKKLNQWSWIDLIGRIITCTAAGVGIVFVLNRDMKYKTALSITFSGFGFTLFSLNREQSYNAQHSQIINHVNFLMYDDVSEKIKKEKTDEILDD